MILFLDTVSPLPEFSLIEDNKIIYSFEILNNKNDKMSDSIIPTYFDLEKKFPKNFPLSSLIVNTGPGSYTALRVGIAFLSGLSLSKGLALRGISCLDLFKYNIQSKDINNTAIYICSSNKQNFIYLFNKEKLDYEIHKIENDFDIKNLINTNIKQVLTNSLTFDHKLITSKNIKFKVINFNKLVSNNLVKILKEPVKNIIEPIYISNNKLLN